MLDGERTPGGPSHTEIRRWAYAHGYRVALHGKVRRDVVRAYLDAHPEVTGDASDDVAPGPRRGPLDRDEPQ